MKKRYFCLALFFEAAACMGAYCIQYFTAKKMGMLRWVNNLCNKWSSRINIDSLNKLLMLLVSVLAVALLVYTMKKLGLKSRGMTALSAMSFCTVGIYIVYTLRYTRRLMAAYYLVSPILLLGAAISLVCWGLAVLKSK